MPRLCSRGIVRFSGVIAKREGTGSKRGLYLYCAKVAMQDLTTFGPLVDVVRHQAPGPDLDPALVAPFGHQGELCSVVVVAEEGLLPTVTPLGDVMGDAGGYDAGDSGHWGKIAEGECGGN